MLRVTRSAGSPARTPRGCTRWWGASRAARGAPGRVVEGAGGEGVGGGGVAAAGGAVAEVKVAKAVELAPAVAVLRRTIRGSRRGTTLGPPRVGRSRRRRWFPVLPAAARRPAGLAAAVGGDAVEALPLLRS